MKTSRASVAWSSPASAAASMSRRSLPAPPRPSRPDLFARVVEQLVQGLAGLAGAGPAGRRRRSRRRGCSAAGPTAGSSPGCTRPTGRPGSRRATSCRPGGTRSAGGRRGRGARPSGRRCSDGSPRGSPSDGCRTRSPSGRARRTARWPRGSSGGSPSRRPPPAACPGTGTPSIRIALTYGGLWAGATVEKASIAWSTRSSTCCRVPPRASASP